MPQSHTAETNPDAAAPNPTHWPAWLDEHGPALLLLARQWTPDLATAEDIVQEGFLRFWRSRENATHPPAYLYACVKRCALEWHRSRHRRKRREESVAEPESSGAALLSGPIELDERRQQIEGALARLPELQREVLVMKVWGMLSFVQIGQALEIPPDTAASRYRYALVKLREQLPEERL